MAVKGFNLIRNKKVAHYLAMILIAVALLIEAIEFITICVEEHFSFEAMFAFIFEVVTNGALIYALARKKAVLIELALVIIKVFEASYYPLESCERLDMLMSIADLPPFYLVTHVLFAVSAFSLLVALIFFCAYKLRNNVRMWDIMKIWVLLSAFAMLVTTVLYIVEINRDENMDWSEILEPIALTILFTGMFMTYEYVEEETIYNE